MRRLVVADHPGAPRGLLELLSSQGEVEGLDLPFWEDSCLSRAMRLHGLPRMQQLAAVAHADRLLGLLRAALRRTGSGDEEWLYFRQVLETHAVTPLAEGVALVACAVERLRPEEIVAVQDVAARDFWSGQAVAGYAARMAARAAGIPTRPLAVINGRPRLLAPLAMKLAPLIRTLAIMANGAVTLRHLRAAAARGAGRAMEPADVLMLAGGPVVERLAMKLAGKLSERSLRCFLLADPPAAGRPTRDGFVAMGAAALMEGRAPKVTETLGARGRAARIIRELRSKVDAGEAEALWPRLVSLEARERPLHRWLAADAEAVLEAVKPRVVVAFQFYPRRATPYLVAARKRGLPTICCQHGLIASLDYPVEWYDRLLVFNQHTAEIAGQAAHGAEIAVVGNPALDGLVGAPPEPARPARAGERPVVVVATQPNDVPGVERRPEWWFRHVARAASSCGAYLAVKLHPDQAAGVHGKMYERTMEAAGAAGEIIEHGQVGLGNLIAGGDVFVSQFSSSILEALVLERPVVFVEMREGPPFYPFDDFGAATRVTRPEEMEKALREALRRGPALVPASFVDRHLAPLDGKALERMAEEIARVCEGP
ncbi:MAG: hypothetical protein H5T86_04110 [Armatimonadetes bacterium]|nr:hypothetical protein [Armatimonadota bacterium]